MLDRLGIDLEYLVLGMLILVLILLITTLVMILKYNALNTKYRKFMRGANGRSLEERILSRFREVDSNKSQIADCVSRIKLL